MRSMGSQPPGNIHAPKSSFYVKSLLMNIIRISSCGSIFCRENRAKILIPIDRWGRGEGGTLGLVRG